eukprot:5177545-Pyramimonas_sp.AAC.1
MQDNNFEGSFVEDIVKAKAHLDVNEEGITYRERFLRRGARMRMRALSMHCSYTHRTRLN